MTVQPPETTTPAPAAPPSGETRYFVIQDPGDSAPWALVAVQPRGLYEMWTGQPGEDEWVDVPFFASYFVGGEIGARAIEEADVDGFKQSIKPPLPGAIALMRGDGKGVGAETPVDDDAPSGDADNDDPEAGTGEGTEQTPDSESSQVSDGAEEDTDADTDADTDKADDPDADDEKPKPGTPGVNPFPKKKG